MEFDIVYADPPWRYDFAPTKSTRIENHYPTMPVEKIASLKVPSAKNSALFLWATAPKLLEAIHVMKEWGFTYKTNMVWDKVRPGTGFWSRVQHEHLLIGTKGKFSPPAYEHRGTSVLCVKKTVHSRKPKVVSVMIEDAYPTMTKLELFGREERDGWVVLGNAIDGKSIEDALAELGGKE